MDEITSFQAFQRTKDRRRGAGRSGARRAFQIAFFSVAAAGLLVVGFRLGRSDAVVPAWVPVRIATMLHASPPIPVPTGPVIYYRDPDGKPSYSAEPKKTAAGRDYAAVRASEDVTFDDAPVPEAPVGQGRILYYRNPMGLPDTSPVPKKDSMGMDYLPVYEGDDVDNSTVKISAGKIQRTGVRSEPVQRRVVSHPVRVPGTVQLDERRVTVVATRSDAFIDKVENVTTGDRVRKGQPLLQIYSPEIAAAGAQFMSSPGFDGSRRRLENLNVPADVIAEIERTHKVPAYIQWTSPRDGLVLERNAIEGMKAPAGQVLFRIADVSVMWVLADVPEYDLGAVKVGETVTMRVRSLPGRTLTGKVDLIYPQVSKETRTTRVRIELSNPDGVLLPDMYADVDITTGSGTPVVAVPDGAVIDTGTRQVVILDKGEGRFEPREVKVGSRGDGYTEIRDGIGENDQVVVAANFLIDAESNLKAALRAFSGPEKAK